MSITLDLLPPLSDPAVSARPIADDPREEMARRIPAILQPFLTWLTAKPVPGATALPHTALHHVLSAFLLLACGLAAGVAALHALHGPAQAAALPLSLLVVTSGMGKLQAVVYHHCSHGTVLAERRWNLLLGRAIGILLLVKHFDAYQREHMLHHSPKKLLTHEDEFAQFVFNVCNLGLGLPKAAIWRRVLLSFASPFFHMRMFMARLSSCLLSQSPTHNIAALLFWGAVLLLVDRAGAWGDFLLVWLLPATVLFQIATALRVLCEHRYPSAEIMAVRDKRFVGHATSGVFAGTMPPAAFGGSLEGFGEWTAWWMRMLTLHLFERVFVLVGDAPAHDFHHRHPASRKWASYIDAREADRQAGCPGYPVDYNDSWGLFRAIDENFALMSLAKGGPN